MSLPLTSDQQAYAHSQKDPLWFLGTLTWIRADEKTTGGRLSLVEQFVPSGFESPWHVHLTEDESFYVIGGHVSVVMGEDRKKTYLGEGGFAFGPRNIPHGFRVESAQPARILLVTTGGDFANFVFEASERATWADLPDPSPPNMPKLLGIAARHNLSILGSMPA